jgi:hypothetical protein
LIIRKVEEEGKNLDDIANEICPTIEYGREKIIRIIKDFLGEEYLIKHAEVLGYDVGKADLARKRKHRAHENIDAGADTVIESNNVTPTSSCQTTVQAVNTEHVKDTGHTKGEQVLEEHDKPIVCCQAVRKMRKTESENITEEESGETKGQEQVLEEQDDAPVVNVPYALVEALRELIKTFSIVTVKAGLDAAIRDI